MYPVFHISTPQVNIAHTFHASEEDMKWSREHFHWDYFGSMTCLFDHRNKKLTLAHSTTSKKKLNIFHTIKPLQGNNATYKIWSFVRFPKEVGISPVKLLFSIIKTTRFVKFPSCSGIFPVMLLPCNSLHNECFQWILYDADELQPIKDKNSINKQNLVQGTTCLNHGANKHQYRIFNSGKRKF